MIDGRPRVEPFGLFVIWCPGKQEPDDKLLRVNIDSAVMKTCLDSELAAVLTYQRSSQAIDDGRG